MNVTAVHGSLQCGTGSPVPLFGEGGFIESDPDRILLSEQSARYLVRQRKAQLVASGALLRIAGKWYVLPDLFRAALLDLGRQDAHASVLDDRERAIAQRRQVLAAMEAACEDERAAIGALEAACAEPEPPLPLSVGREAATRRIGAVVAK